jgi:multimeric flavodoxin WrbA
MSKTLILNGSPRREGNTSFLVERLKKYVERSGNEVKILFLNDYKIKPCRGCFWCYREFPLKCIQSDVMNDLYPIILDTDVLIFASPVYWFNYPAQLKLLVDRLVALHVKDGHALDGRKFATIFVYGDTDSEKSGVYTAINSIDQMIKYFKGTNLGVIHGTGGDNRTAPNNQKLLDDLEELANKICECIR